METIGILYAHNRFVFLRRLPPLLGEEGPTAWKVDDWFKVIGRHTQLVGAVEINIGN